MNKRVALAATLFCISAFASAGMAAEGYDMLFKGTKSKLSMQERQQIFKQLGFRLSKNKKFIVDDTCGEDVIPEVEIVDLNGDGMEEVFVSWGNTCTSGGAGQSITLFVKDGGGCFEKKIDVPGSYEKLPSKHNGFPDLMIGGPGFCHGVWQWEGGKYAYKCSREENSGDCAAAGVKTVCK